MAQCLRTTGNATLPHTLFFSSILALASRVLLRKRINRQTYERPRVRCIEIILGLHVLIRVLHRNYLRLTCTC